jgi:hypothetical protein
MVPLVKLDVRPILDGDELSGFGPSFGYVRDSPRRCRTLVATTGTAVVAVASATWSARHVDVVFANAEVDAAGRWNEVGVALLEALEADVDRPLLFNLDVSERGLARLLAAHGYRKAVSSSTARFHVCDALEILQRRTGDGAMVQSSTLTREVEDLFEKIYAERHQWAGAYISPVDTSWIAEVGEIVAETLFVARDELGLIAATAVHLGTFAEGADGFIAPTGVVARARLGAGRKKQLISELLYRSLQGAFEAGIESVNIEYDTPYVELAEVIRQIPSVVVSGREIWLK